MSKDDCTPINLVPWFPEPAYKKPSFIWHIFLYYAILAGIIIHFPFAIYLINRILHKDEIVWKLISILMLIASTAYLYNLPFILIYNYSFDKLSSRLRALVLGALPNYKSAVLFYGIYMGTLIVMLILWVAYSFKHLLNLIDQIYRALYLPYGRFVPEFPPYSYLHFIVLCFLVIWIVIEIRAAKYYLQAARELPLQFTEDIPHDLPHSIKSSKVTAYVAHFSDLHLTADEGRAKLADGSHVGGNKMLEQLIGLHEITLQIRANVVVITGDITDSGHADEWEHFFKLVPDAILRKTVLVPGNHEFNIPDPKNWLTTYYGSDDPRRLVKALRYILAADRVQGDRAFILKYPDYSSMRGLITLREYLQTHKKSLESYVQAASNGDFHLKDWAFAGERNQNAKKHFLAQILDQIFPMAVKAPNSDLVTFVMNSNGVSSNLVTNAIGSVSDIQLVRLSRLIPNFSNKPFIFAMHHHVGVPILNKLSIRKGVLKTGVAQLFERSLAVDNGASVIAALGYYIPHSTVMFNGHRHVSYRATIGNRFQIVASPSTTLGDESGRFDKKGFGIYSISWNVKYGTCVGSETWCDESGLTTFM